MSRRICVTRVPAAWILAIAVGACSDSTGPEAFDAASTSDAAASVVASFGDNPALAALDLLSDAFPGMTGSSVAAPSSPLTDGPAWPVGVDDDLQFLAAVGPFLNPANPAAIFPADLLGTTFVYDVDSLRYVPAPDSAGAPANGIRLKLYAVDPILHRPVTPLDDIGHLDLTDESSPSADAIGVLADVDGVTYLDYVASAVRTTSTLTFSAVGYLSDGQNTVEFTLSHEWSETTGITIDYLVTVPREDTGVHLTVNVNGQTEVVSLEMAVEHDDDTVVLSATGTDAGLDGTITFNGVVVVDIAGTPQQPVFTDADGNALTNQDLQALAALFGSIGIILDGFDNLLIPAYLVFSISVFTEW